MIGIIANPSSGKDIRRLVANATCFDNMEKVNIIQRIMVVLNEMSNARILMMEDSYGTMEKAMENIRRLMGIKIDCDFIPMSYKFAQIDSQNAGEKLHQLGAKCIITLGGDGTNRAVAKGCGETPLIPISTGTNNVFPTMMEGTVVGLAALVAELDTAGEVLKKHRCKKINIYKNDKLVDIALIDAVVTSDLYIGSRAVWNTESIKELFVTVAKPDSIGMSAIAGSFHAINEHEHVGLHVRCGENARFETWAPIAPGLIHPVGIVDYERMHAGQRIQITETAGTIALDGEREVEFVPGDKVEVELTLDGPYVIDVPDTLRCAANKGYFVK